MPWEWLLGWAFKKIGAEVKKAAAGDAKAKARVAKAKKYIADKHAEWDADLAKGA